MVNLALNKVDSPNQPSGGWLENKKNEDRAEGLWRIYDDIYDVTSFIDKHPGGRFWLEYTKGLDVTALFESHHIKSDRPQELLKRFYVKKAETPTASPYTFREDGFYKTLKREVRELLKTIPEEARVKRFKTYTDILMVLTFLVAILANYLWSHGTAFIAGVFATFTLTAGHNYCHQRDNFRMYYLDLIGLNGRDFRVVHVISHHLQPNTTNDIQLAYTLPYLDPFPKKKSFIVRYLSWFYGPLIYFSFIIMLGVVLRLYEIIALTRKAHTPDFFFLLLPLSMYLFGGQSFVATIFMWQIIMVFTSFCYSVNSLTNAHVHPDVYIEGDLTRPSREIDWGMHQIETVCERYEVNASDFLVLVSFGEHALHHLFPTLDHSVLHFLNPVALKVMEEYHLKLKVTNQADMSLGFFRRLALEHGKVLQRL